MPRTCYPHRTGIKVAMGLAVDSQNGEIWISNYGKPARVWRQSDGNVAPKRAAQHAGGTFARIWKSHGAGL